MASRNSPNDLRAAVKNLARMKGDVRTEQGGRVIWHKSADGELVSWVDEKGRLLKQLLVLFEDAVLWQHGQRMRSGELKQLAARQRNRNLLIGAGAGVVLLVVFLVLRAH